jgi:FGGY-family pentulose kinase/HAD superfamily hydrolase (TIGR01509 family)
LDELMASPPIRLVIFDLDGVLVDSEPIAMRVLLSAIDRAGATIEADDAYRQFLGRSLESISKSLGESHGLTLGQPALESMRHDLFARYREELRPAPWLSNTLEALGLPLCVASSSGLERIQFSLEVTGLLGHFNGHIFSASMVERGKPAPDLFLHAAREMNVPPEQCVVVEDSPAGIRAAKAAGMHVFAYLGGSHIEPAGLKHEIAALATTATFEDMRALTGLVALHQARAEGRPPNLLAAVDVGTSSARAGIIDGAGQFLARAELPFGMRRADGTVFEHDSEEIWSAVCGSVREAVNSCGASPAEVVGISFDATCSLVVRDAVGGQVTVSTTGEDRYDTISWMDHRAQSEAAEATATGHTLLSHLGGVMSPEMQTPKLMWLKRHLPQSWARAHHLFDLSDFLSWRASGSVARSQCTLTCKWAYLPHAGGWQHDLLAHVGLADLVKRGGLPDQATPIGEAVGTLTQAAAAALGLTTACKVGMGLIDAHAGALGVIGRGPVSVAGQLTLVGGTSSCVMALSPDPRPIVGVWGPYMGAVLPGHWLNEAGQSATGSLLEHIVRSHPAGGEPTSQLHGAILLHIAELRVAEGDAFAPRLHVLPDFHGNRSPLGEPRAKGVVSGLTLDESFDGLCRLYFRTAVAIALGVRHILEALHEGGYDTARMHLTGGHLHNPLLVELYADATGATLDIPDAIDATLLGTAIAAAVAAGLHADLASGATTMRSGFIERAPNASLRAAYDHDYTIFGEMLTHRRRLEVLEESSSTLRHPTASA